MTSAIISIMRRRAPANEVIATPSISSPPASGIIPRPAPPLEGTGATTAANMMSPGLIRVVLPPAAVTRTDPPGGGVGVAVGVSVGAVVGVATGVAVGLTLPVAVAVAVAPVAVAVGVPPVAVGDADPVAVGVGVAEPVAVGVAVAAE